MQGIVGHMGGCMDMNTSIEKIQSLFDRLMPRDGFYIIIIIYEVIVTLQPLCNDQKDENNSVWNFGFGAGTLVI